MEGKKPTESVVDVSINHTLDPFLTPTKDCSACEAG
jgi:hypothetical protein